MKIKMPNKTYFHVAFWKQFMGWIAEFVSKEMLTVDFLNVLLAY